MKCRLSRQIQEALDGSSIGDRKGHLSIAEPLQTLQENHLEHQNDVERGRPRLLLQAGTSAATALFASSSLRSSFC
ncbi:MAG: hypothetical protein V8T46_08870 [Sutterella seckii]